MAWRKVKEGASDLWKKIWTPCARCLVGGTLVSMEQGLQPIETIGLGQRSTNQAEECARLPLEGWVRIDFELFSEDGESVGVVEVLRPAWLVEELGADIWEPLRSDNDELGEEEVAIPVAVSRGHTLAAGSGCPVTAVFER